MVPRSGFQIPPVVLAAFLSLGASVASARAERYECLVEPYLEVKLASGVPGILEAVLVDRGDRVKRGEVLARLRSDVQRADYDLAKARAEFAARRVQRNEDLYQKQMISIHEKDEMETEAQLLRLELRQAEEHLKLRTIESPLEGVVVRRHNSPGEYVEDQPILDLAQIDPLRIEVVVPVSLYGKLRAGMAGQVEWEAPLSGFRREGRVTVVDPVVDAASGTIGIRLEVPNPDHTLPAGTKCWVSFPVGAASSSGR
jgi:RND family efflux transporter MFP subunit